MHTKMNMNKLPSSKDADDASQYVLKVVIINSNFVAFNTDSGTLNSASSSNCLTLSVVKRVATAQNISFKRLISFQIFATLGESLSRLLPLNYFTA